MKGYQAHFGKRTVFLNGIDPACSKISWFLCQVWFIWLDWLNTVELVLDLGLYLISPTWSSLVISKVIVTV